MHAGADDTRAKFKQFEVLLCLPMAPVLLLMERRLRYVPDLWTPWGKMLLTRKCVRGAPDVNCNGS